MNAVKAIGFIVLGLFGLFTLEFAVFCISPMIMALQKTAQSR
jgi:hypothetical protein